MSNILISFLENPAGAMPLYVDMLGVNLDHRYLVMTLDFLDVPYFCQLSVYQKHAESFVLHSMAGYLCQK